MISNGGKVRLRLVHHLVLEAFKGLKPPGKEARHLDGNFNNNVITNLEWGTHAENIADQIVHGTDTRGERNGGAKLKNEDASSIRASSLTGKELASKYGVSEATISRIKKGRRYATV